MPETASSFVVIGWAASAAELPRAKSVKNIWRFIANTSDRKSEVFAMKRQMFLTLLALGSSAALAAQPMTTKLDAVSGIPKMDSTTQTQDVKFKSGEDDRMTVPVRLSGS